MQQNHTYQIVDTQSVSTAFPELSVRNGSFTHPDYVVDCDIFIAGGGTGGVAAALRSTSAQMSKRGLGGLKVCMTEETDWIGGQMTAQGVSALDENYLVDTTGSTRSYQQFRTNIRNYYKRSYKLAPEYAQDPVLNPGSCWVTRLSFEPKVAVQTLTEMLKDAIDAGRLSIYTRQKPIYVKLKSGEIVCAGSKRRNDESESCEIQAVGTLEFETGKIFEFRPKVCIDATELGDLLPMAGLHYSVGSDDRAVTAEAHAPEHGDPDNVQDFTYPFVVEYCPNEKHTIDKPPLYEEFSARGKFTLQNYKMFDAVPRGVPEDHPESPDVEHTWYLPFWEYRRLIAKKVFADDAVAHDIAMINWESNDLRGENIIDKVPDLTADRLAQGKLVSLGFLYWLQTEAPRDDGGKGYPELKLRPDVMGSSDGLSKFPYIRESRRIEPKRRIVERDIVASSGGTNARAANFADSVGIGFYPVDIHGHQEVPGAGQATKPFQISLDALIPTQTSNILPACKNIGTTHITNGAYRLHPIEWAIGEAQGALAVLLCTKHLHLKTLAETPSILALQQLLAEQGAPVYWYEDVPTSHAQFAAIQFLGVSDIMRGDTDHLSFYPDRPITRGEAAFALAKIMPGARGVASSQKEALSWCIEKNYLARDLDDTAAGNPTNSSSNTDEGQHRSDRNPNVALAAKDVEALARHLNAGYIRGAQTLSRGEFAEVIYKIAKTHLEAVKVPLGQ